jgi:ELWxxDGT repeat protein
MRKWLLNVWRMCLGFVAEQPKPSRPSHKAQLGFEQLEDRTVPATFLVRNIFPGAGSSSPGNFTEVNGTLFFVARQGRFGAELWKSDGTSSGTVMVRDIRPGTAGSNPSYLTNVNGTLFFTADNGTKGRELWKSDGTSTGTVLVRDIWPGSARSHPRYLTNVNGTLFFTADDGTKGRELWKSDGTSAGTVLVKDIWPGSGDSRSVWLTNVNGTLFFRADDGTSGYELWKSDGTSTGTVLVRNIRPGSADSNPAWLANVNGTLFFRANDGTSGYELWKSDGTSSGTVPVRDIRSGSASSDPTYLTNVNGTVFFWTGLGSFSSTIELWKSDGTSSGTVMVKAFRPSTFGSGANKLTNVNGTLFFAANDGTNGLELWKSDGTSGGTVMVKDIRPGSASSEPSGLTNVNGVLFFLADDGTYGKELWFSYGDANSTYLVQDIRPGSAGSSPTWLTNVNGTLFFAASDGTHGMELWASDELEPEIIRVSPPANGNYSVEDDLYFEVEFSEPVLVTGTPRLVLRFGSNVGGSIPPLDRYATYESGSGTTTLRFRYTVAAEDLDSDSITLVTPIDLNGGSIRDRAGNHAQLDFTPPLSVVLVNHPGPVIANVSGPGSGIYKLGQNLDFTVVFDRPVVVDTTFGTPRLQLTIGDATRYAIYQPGSGSSSLLFRYPVQSDDLDTDGITVVSPLDLNGGTIKDTADNAAALVFVPPDTSGVLVDTVPPSIVQVTPPANGWYRAGGALEILIRFSEPVTVGTTSTLRPHLQLRIGSRTADALFDIQPDPTTLRFRSVVQSGDLDTDGIEILSPILLPAGTFIRDQAGHDAITTFTNPSTPNVKVDAVAPTIVLVTPPANGHYVTGQALDIVVRFSESVNVGTTSTAKPFIQLRIGSVIRNAVFYSQPDSRTLRFRYVIQSSDRDTNGIEILSPIMRPTGTFIRDMAGNDAIVSFTPPKHHRRSGELATPRRKTSRHRRHNQLSTTAVLVN